MTEHTNALTGNEAMLFQAGQQLERALAERDAALARLTAAEAEREGGEGMSDDQSDVTIRIPVGFDSTEERAGWFQAAVTEAMRRQGWIGEAAVLYRKGGDGPIVMFHEGIVDPYDGTLPHNLCECDDARD